MRTPQQQADTYAKVIDFLNKTTHQEDENFNEILESECQKNEINAHHLKVIMGIETFRIGKAEEKYTQMNVRFQRHLVIKEPTKINAIKVKIEFKGWLYHFFSTNTNGDFQHFKNLVEFYLPGSKIEFIRRIVVSKIILNKLDLENNLMLISEGKSNHFNIKL